MPRNTREYLKRQTDQIENDFNRIITNCSVLLDIYGENYPEHTAFIAQFGELVINLRDMLIEFKNTKM